MALDHLIHKELNRAANSLEKMAAAAQLPSLEIARGVVKSEYDQAPEGSDQEKDAQERLDKLDRNIRRAESALGIPEGPA